MSKPDSSSRNLSRRAFLATGGFAITAMGLMPVEGQEGSYYSSSSLLAPEVALAQDAEGTFPVTILGESDVELVVFDVTDPDISSARGRVQGAHVTVSDVDDSWHRDYVTDENGSVHLSLKDGICPEPYDSSPKYYGSVKVTVWCGDHRTVVIPRMTLIGHSAYALPLPACEGNEVYFRQFSFNKADVQYTNSTFLYTSTFNDTVEIAAEVNVPNSYGVPTVELCRWRSEEETFPGFEAAKDDLLYLDASVDDTWLDNDTRAYKIVSNGQYLKTRADEYFQKGDRVIVKVTLGADVYYAIGRATFKEGVFDAYSTKASSLLPKSLTGTDFKFVQFGPFFGDKSGAAGKSDISVQLPIDIPYLVAEFYPGGWVKLGVGTKDTCKQDNPGTGNPIGGEWKSVGYESGMKAFEKSTLDCEKAIEAQKGLREKAIDAAKGTKSKIPVIAGLQLSFLANVYAAGVWNEAHEYWVDSLNGILQGSGSVSWTIPFTLAGFPMFFTVEFSASLGFNVTLAGTCPYAFDRSKKTELDIFASMFNFANMTWDEERTNFGLTIPVGIAVSVGAGYSGVCSLSLRGSGGINMWFNLEMAGGASWNALITATANLYVLFQAWCFKMNVAIAAGSWQLYPKKEASLAALCGEDGEFIDNGDGITLEQLLEQAVPVTQDMLGESKEATCEAGAAQVSLLAGLGAEDEGDSLLSVTSVETGDGRRNLVFAPASKLQSFVDEMNSAQAASLCASGDGEDELKVPEDEADDWADCLGLLVDEEPVLDYSYTQDDSHVPDGGADSSRLLCVSETGGVGIEPSKILADVYSDGRPKFARFSLGDGGKVGDCLLRIASVYYADTDTYCPRLTLRYRTGNGWGGYIPIDIPVQVDGELIDSSKVFDYSFDVAEFEDSGYRYLAIMLLSGVREAEVDDIEQSASKPITSLVIVGPRRDGDVWKPAILSSRSWLTSLEASTYGDKTFVTYSPVVGACQTYWQYSGSKKWRAFVISGGYLYKEQDKKDNYRGILSDDVEAKPYFFTTYGRFDFDEGSDNPDIKIAAELFPAKNIDETAEKVTGITELLHGSMHTVFNDYGMYTGHFVGFKTKDAVGIYEVDFGGVPNMDGVIRKTLSTYINKLVPDPGIKTLCPWQEKTMLAVKLVGEGDEATDQLFVLQLPDRRSRDKISVGTESTLGPTTGVPADFLVGAGGNVLLYPKNEGGAERAVTDENGDPVVDEDGSYKTETMPDSFSIMAMTAVKDGDTTLFTKPFVVASLDQPVDAICAVDSDDETTDIVFCSITDLDQSLADYYEISVPCTACATPVGLLPLDMVSAGEDCRVQIKVRNDGNTVLRGAHFTLVEAGSGAVLVDDLEVEFSADTVVDSSDREADGDDGAVFTTAFEGNDDHLLCKDGGRTAIAPGQDGTVVMTVGIPEGWTGTHDITVRTSKVSYLDPITGETVVSDNFAGDPGVLLCSDDGDAGSGASREVRAVFEINGAEGDLSAIGGSIEGREVVSV